MAEESSKKNEPQAEPSDDGAFSQHDPDSYKARKGDFDLYNITEKLSDHLTDEVFRHLIVRKNWKGDLVKELDQRLKENIQKELIPEVTSATANQIKKRLKAELKEQYHAEGPVEKIFDKSIAGARWIMAVVYLLLATTLGSILLYTFTDVWDVSVESITHLIVHPYSQDVEDIQHAWQYNQRRQDPAGDAQSSLRFRPQTFQLNDSTDDSRINIVGEFERVYENDGKKKSKSGGEGSLDAIIAPTVKLLDLVLIGSLVVMVLIGGYENTVSRIGMSHSMPVWLGKLTISALKVKVAASIVIISSIHLLMEFLKLDFPTKSRELVEMEYYLPLIATSIIHLVFILSAMAITYIDKIEHETHHNSAKDDGEEHT